MSISEASPAGRSIVEMRGITISFPGVLALDNVDFSLRSGEVHALMGENGAGKSTLIKALTGVYPVDSGEIAVAGRPVVFHTTADAQVAGISTVYQEVNLCQNLSDVATILTIWESSSVSSFVPDKTCICTGLSAPASGVRSVPA